MYKLLPITIIGPSNCVYRQTDGAFVPFAELNTDYQKFRTDLANGAELQDPDGNVMTPEQVQEFLATLS